MSYTTSEYVGPDGPVPCDVAIVGEAPASEEVAQGRGFVGPSGRIIWPLLKQYAGLERAQCYVTNLCKHPLDNDVSGDAKMTTEEFQSCKHALWEELDRVGAKKVLAVGSLAAQALMGGDFTTMRECSGGVWKQVARARAIVPTFHPAAALRPGGEDKLAFTAAAMEVFKNPIVPIAPSLRHPLAYTGESGIISGPIAVDTEGTPDNPYCLTFAYGNTRWFVEPRFALTWWKRFVTHTVYIYHNAPWDWAVMEAMGIPEPWSRPYADTMEMAYLRQTEPQGLKALAWKHLRIAGQSWDEVVRPHYEEQLLAAAQGWVDAHTVIVTHSFKTGRPFKKPKVQMEELVKPLARVLKTRNVKLLSQRYPFPEMSSDMVPKDLMVEYATKDPALTLLLWEKWTLLWEKWNDARTA